MPIAAVPNYLGRDFKDASPALRFGMLLPLWGINRRTKQLLWTTSDIDYKETGKDHIEREIRVENKESALRQAAQLNKTDIDAMHALAARQKHLAASPAFQVHMLTLCATATAPFTTGLGNEHPLENGFAFLTPYGLPYLAGSGVKGVLRQAARELAEEQWGDTRGWSKEKKYTVTIDEETKKTACLSMFDVLFGYEADSGETLHTSGVLDFWDVIPQIKGDALAVEVMTPHQGHYYQQKNDRKSGSSTTPHDSGQPNPITFLTVPPGSAMNFYVRCDEARLATLAQELMEKTESGEPRWKTLLTAAFEHAFEWLGFGAKTAVGYGAMQRDKQAEDKQQQAAQKVLQAQKDAAEMSALSPAMREVRAFERECKDKVESMPGSKMTRNGAFYQKAKILSDAARANEWSEEEKRAAAEAILEWLPKVESWGAPKDAKRELRKKLNLTELAPSI